MEAVSPLTIADAVAPGDEAQGSLAGAVGLAQRWSVARSLPVNLAVAKRVQVAVSPNRRRWLVYGVAAGLLLRSLSVHSELKGWAGCTTCSPSARRRSHG